MWGTGYADGQGQLRMGVRYSDETRQKSILYRQSNAEPFRTIAARQWPQGRIGAGAQRLSR